ncbi:MAG: S8 family serine peptidase, partial [Muribaculaceae bacterium]|nr:S8 family serine peptidase [Muribaculaceae bacterium]
PTLPPIDDEDIIVRDGHRLAGNRLNVLFGAETDRQDAARWTDSFKELYPSGINQVLFYDPETKLMSVQVDPSMRAEMLTALPGQISDIEFIVFEETVMEPTERPSDPIFGNSELSWFYEPTGIYDAWDITQGSENVIVAVVDSYFDLDNQEFAHTSIVSPYSVANGSSDVSLPDGYSSSSPDQVLAHGTMVSGLIFAAPDNGNGAAGISPGCQFMPVSLGHRFGCLAMLQGLLYAINHGAKVVNISAGLSFAEEVENLSDIEQITLSRNILLDQENVWKYVFDMAEKFYVTIVWAAGNDNIFTAIDASKRGDKTIKVSSVGCTLNKANFSNYGNFPAEGIFESTVSAPGEHIYGLLPGTDHGLDVKGTSFSAPIVAGAVGLMKSLDMSLGTRQIVSILQSTGKPVESDSRVGPSINVAKALERVREGFLPYDSLAAYMAAASGVLMVPTTLNSPLELTDTAASTAL